MESTAAFNQKETATVWANIKGQDEGEVYYCSAAAGRYVSEHASCQFECFLSLSAFCNCTVEGRTFLSVKLKELQLFFDLHSLSPKHAAISRSSVQAKLGKPWASPGRLLIYFMSTDKLCLLWIVDKLPKITLKIHRFWVTLNKCLSGRLL